MGKKVKNTANASIVRDNLVVDNSAVVTSASTENCVTVVECEEKSDNCLSEMNFTELYSVLKCVKNICQKYENTLKNYDGTILDNSSDYKKFQYYNQLYMLVLNVIEMKLKELK